MNLMMRDRNKKKCDLAEYEYLTILKGTNCMPFALHISRT